MLHRTLTSLALVLGIASPQPAQARCDDAALSSAQLEIIDAAPVRFETDITRRASARITALEPFDVKVRRAARHARGFNNEPRYELAAYALQKLLFDAGREVVPPTALRSMPLGEFRAIDPRAVEAFEGTGAALFVVQCWLQGAKPLPVRFDETRFARDRAFARAMANLNVLTYLIEHKDSNPGNVMVTGDGAAVRLWAIDNGVAFASEEGDRGVYWKKLYVSAIDPAVHARLEALEIDALHRQLGVLAELVLEGGRWRARPPGENLGPSVGVRRAGEVLQLGLTRTEIGAVNRRVQLLLRQVRSGRVALLEPESR